MLFTQLLQEAPAETTGYMLAGYIIIFGTMLVYLISIILRRRNLDQDMHMLDDLQRKSNNK